MIHTTALRSVSLKIKLFWGAILLALLVVASSAAYYWYSIYRAENSQIFLSDCLFEYRQQLESNEPAWQDVVMMTDLAYEQTTFAPYKPYLLVIKAQGYAQQGNITDAIVMMDQALAQIPTDSPYKHEYMLTKALMQLDAQEDAVQEQGLSQLQELAATDHLFQDVAIYYLAHYYQIYDNQQALTDILNQAREQNFSDSPWIAKLKQEFAL